MVPYQGQIQDFKLGGAHLKKNAHLKKCGLKKNTPKNHIFSNGGGRRENCWGISCGKSRFNAKKNHIFSNFRGRGGAPGAHPPWIAPAYNVVVTMI